MTMKNRGLMLLSGAVMIALILTSAYAAQGLPADARVPIHWNSAGRIDGDAPKWIALMIAPAMAAITSLVFLLISVAEPHQDNLASSRTLFRIAWIGMLATAVVIEIAQLSVLYGWAVSVPTLIIGGIGLFFVVLGNQLAKSRPMYMVGIRTPWTLANADVWVATHRRGGQLMEVAGLMWLVAAAFGWVGRSAMPLLTAAMLAAAIAPIVYSYLLWRRIARHG